MKKSNVLLLVALLLGAIIASSCNAPKRLKCNNKRYCDVDLRGELNFKSNKNYIFEF